MLACNTSSNNQSEKSRYSHVVASHNKHKYAVNSLKAVEVTVSIKWMIKLTTNCLHYVFILCTIELNCCTKTIKNTPVSHTAALADTFFSHSVSCTQSCCCNYSLEHQMYINSWLKIAPIKCTISSCVAAVVGNYWTTWKINLYICDSFLLIYVFSRTQPAWGSESQTEYGSITTVTNC